MWKTTNLKKSLRLNEFTESQILLTENEWLYRDNLQFNEMGFFLFCHVFRLNFFHWVFFPIIFLIRIFLLQFEFPSNSPSVCFFLYHFLLNGVFFCIFSLRSNLLAISHFNCKLNEYLNHISSKLFRFILWFFMVGFCFVLLKWNMNIKKF